MAPGLGAAALPHHTHQPAHFRETCCPPSENPNARPEDHPGEVCSPWGNEELSCGSVGVTASVFSSGSTVGTEQVPVIGPLQFCPSASELIIRPREWGPCARTDLLPCTWPRTPTPGEGVLGAAERSPEAPTRLWSPRGQLEGAETRCLPWGWSLDRATKEVSKVQ